MSSTNVRTRIGQFQQTSSTASFAAISADAIYVGGVLVGTGDVSVSSLSAGLNTFITESASGIITIGELSGIDINFIGISGTTVTVDPGTNTVTIDGGGAGGTVTSVSGRNIGGGAEIYAKNESGTGIFRSISAAGGITITQSGSGIEIGSSTASGEANTASNTGEAGTAAGIFRQKTGINLEFKSLSAGANVGITDYGTHISISGSAAGGGGGLPYPTGATAGVNLETFGLTASSISAKGGITGSSVSTGILLNGQFQSATANILTLQNVQGNYAVLTANNRFTASMTAVSISALSITARNTLSAGTISAGNTKVSTLWFSDNTFQVTAGVTADLNLSVCATSTGTSVSTNETTKIIKVSRNPITASTNAISAGSISVSNILVGNLWLYTTTVTSGSYSVTSTVNFLSGSVTAVLPTPVGKNGTQLLFKTTGPCSATLSAIAGLIDNSITQVIITPYTSLTVISNNTDWYIF